jgi:hypothetical protein
MQTREVSSQITGCAKEFTRFGQVLCPQRWLAGLPASR